MYFLRIFKPRLVQYVLLVNISFVCKRPISLLKLRVNFNQVLCYNKTFNSELSEQRIPKYFCFYLIFNFLEIFFTNNFYKNYFRKILHSFSLAKLIEFILYHKDHTLKEAMARTNVSNEIFT